MLQDVPDWKDSYARNYRQIENWDRFVGSMREAAYRNETEAPVLGEIFAGEGFMQPARNSSAVAGMLEGMLRDLAEKGFVDPIHAEGGPMGLEPEDVPAVYRGYFDQALHAAGGHRVLRQLDPQAGYVLGDTLFRHGSGGGATIIQEAIREVCGDPSFSVDGSFGPVTLGAYRRLIGDPERRNVLFERIETARGQDGDAGGVPRFKRWRVWP